ncbi:MAG: terpene cyclase/mutase family protein, partial [Lacipirellulaceae bacterium]
LDKAIDFVLATQREDGLFSHDAPNTPVTAWHGPTHTAMYNHPIAGLLLTEAYGMVPGTEEQKDLKQAIERGIKFTLSKQLRPGPYKEEDGGWGYLRFANEPGRGETDLSVTGWHMMFLRSAKNAGFEVPDEPMQAAAKYVIRCFEREGTFVYGPVPADRIVSRGMTGAGILSLGMAGQHKTPQARKAADWLLKHPVDKYNVAVPNNRMDRFHYGVHYASHGMYQLGGKHWKEFYPTMAGTMLSGQTRTGAWPRDSTSDRNFGAHYSSALAILSLTPPYQLLSIYQR